jgi:iron(III) transport system substrate-binding protein
VPEVLDALGAKMREKYQIQMSVERLTTAPLIQRYQAELAGGNPAADIIAHSDGVFMEDAVSKSQLARLDGLPSISTWPANAWNGYFTPIAIAPQGIGWNTDLVKPADAPKQWRDVLDPKWKGQIMIVDPRLGAATSWLLFRETYGDEFLRGIAAQNPQLGASQLPAFQQVAAGAAAIMLTVGYVTVQPLKAQGAPVDSIFPEPSTGAEVVAGVSPKAPNPNAARLLMNYMMSQEGQILLNGNGSSMLGSLPGVQPLPRNYSSPKTKQAQEQQAEMVRLLGVTA